MITMGSVCAQSLRHVWLFATPCTVTRQTPLQSCPTLSDPMDRSLPDSSIHGIFQERVLEWGAIAFSVYIYSSRVYIVIAIVVEFEIC